MTGIKQSDLERIIITERAPAELKRQLAIVKFVQKQYKPSFRDLVEHFEYKVSIQTFHRDCKALRELGIDIHSRKGIYKITNIEA
jgi:predicted DNA-binding transcriptional regulator YafY